MKKYILFIISIFTTSLLFAQCVDNGNYWNQSWVSCTTNPNPNPVRGNSHWLLYEFHESQYIDDSYVWNANRTGESGWGAQNVVVDYSVDGTTWIELGQYTFPQAPETSTYAGFVGPDFGGVQLQKILITVLNTHGSGSCASIAEMQFKIDQTACYGTIDACGICNGGGEATWYLDADNDGFGDINNTITSCTQPLGYVANDTDACDNGYLGWSEMSTLFANNGCSNACHGGGASGGLDLRSYASTALGGNLCGTSLLTGTKFVDIITVSGHNACGTPMPIPSMNDRTGGQFDAQELAQLQAWIDGGAPELCTNYSCPPAAVEVPYNGVDDDCNPLTLDDDLDGDGLSYTIDCDDTTPDVMVRINVLLEGAYNTSSGMMNTDLTNLLPLAQPFNRLPWNYTGTEQLTSIPNNMVDWVLLEARAAGDDSQILARKAAIILNNGDIIDADHANSYTGVWFDCLDATVPYYFIVRSRNHLAVISNAAVLGNANTMHDFTNPATVRGGTTQLSNLGNGSYGLLAGDYNSDGIISVADFNGYVTNLAAINQYLDSDFNLDRVITVSDYNTYIPNASKIGVFTVRY